MLRPNMTIKELQAYIKEIDHKPDQLFQVMMKLMEEVGELAEEVRKETTYGPTEETITNIKHELYDIIHFVNHVANIYDIDLAQAIIQKDLINRKRYEEGIHND